MLNDTFDSILQYTQFIKYSFISFRAYFLVAVLAKSANASLRLNLASSITPAIPVSYGVLYTEYHREGEIVPASASEEKLADHWTKVEPSFGPVVTA